MATPPRQYIVPEVVIFEHANFMGLHRRFNIRVPDVSQYEAYIHYDEFSTIEHSHRKIPWGTSTPNEDRVGISSVIVISGTWKFYEYPNFRGRTSPEVLPGAYSFVGIQPKFDMQNDNIMSFECISDQPEGDGYQEYY